MLTASKATGDNIAGMVTYESIGYIFPRATPRAPAGASDARQRHVLPAPSDPSGIPPKRTSRSSRASDIQFVWGDNRPEDYSFVIQSRLCAKLINKYAEMYHLRRQRGGPEAGGRCGALTEARTSPLPTWTTTRSLRCSSSSCIRTGSTATTTATATTGKQCGGPRPSRAGTPSHPYRSRFSPARLAPAGLFLACADKGIRKRYLHLVKIPRSKWKWFQCARL